MTQEEKELLLTDLCARTLYGVICLNKVTKEVYKLCYVTSYNETTMEINELFIGAWVMNRGIPAQVTGITCDGILETTAYRYTNIERVEPIKLSPRIMSAIGFEEKDCDGEPLWSFEYNQYLVTFMSHNGCPSLTIEDVSGNGSHHNVLVVKDEIYNLHELQRAFMVFDIPCDFKLTKPF